jgi:hypothetical protein
VPPDAPPDDLDTLEQAKAIEVTLTGLNREVSPRVRARFAALRP